MTEHNHNNDDLNAVNASSTSRNKMETEQKAGQENNNSAPEYQRSHSKNDTAKKKAVIKKAVIALVVIIVLAVIAYGLFKSNEDSKPAVTTFQGQMQMQQTSIAAKVPGRISNILVTEGDRVEKGQQLIEMDPPEINAKINQAQAAKQAAQSQLDKAINGARPQEIAQARAAWQANKAAADLAANTYERIDRLYKEGLMSRQKRDEAYAQYLATQDQTEAARLQYDIALEGTRSEDEAAAAAQVAQADAKLEEALVAKDEANLQSPIAGLVDDVIVNAGEVVGQGVPLLTLVDTDDQWVVLNVTESFLNHFTIGKQFTGTIPALRLSSSEQPQSMQFTVYATSVLSDFATWRPTNNDDGFDVRTFEIKARPTNPDSRVRSGMSVIVEIDSKSSAQPNRSQE